MDHEYLDIHLKCDECGDPDYTIRRCSTCKRKYCSYKCQDKIVTIHNKIICKSCIGIMKKIE